MSNTWKSPQELPVSTIGIAATRGFIESSGHGAVTAVFRRSCYCQWEGGPLFCVADGSSGAGPITLSVNLPETANLEDMGVAIGAPVVARDSRIYLGNRIILSLDSADIWQPTQVSEFASTETIQTRLLNLAAGLKPSLPPAGLAPLLPHVAQLAQGRIPQIPNLAPLTDLAAPRVARLCHGILNDAPGIIDEAVQDLVGLGPGLTPSGDDLLAGLLVALAAISAPDRIMPALVESVQTHARTGTNRISQALLEQAAEGNGSQRQHQFLSQLLGAASDDRVETSAIALTQVGHTSGWDSLVGLMLGTHLGLVLERRSTYSPPIASGSTI
ncbi:MAG: DUF2877 domain-containing protein [Dehalococcoidia bacterium]